MLALATSHCSLFLAADTGYAHAFAQAPERSAVPLNAYVGIGAGGKHGAAGGGWSLRTKWSDNVQQFSLAPFYYVLVGAEENEDGSPPVAAFLLGGFDIFTVESVAGVGAGSIGSPFVQLGAFFHVHRLLGLTASVSFEDDIRFNAVPSTGYVSFLLGVGAVRFNAPVHVWH